MSSRLEEAVHDALESLRDLAPEVPEWPFDGGGRDDRPDRRQRTLVIAAAILLVSAGAIGLIAASDRFDGGGPANEPAPPTTPVMAAAAPLGGPELFPAFPIGDERNEGAEATYILIADRTAQTTAVIGQRTGDQLADVMTITGYEQLPDDAFEGAAATTAVIDGVEVDVYDEPGRSARTTVVVPGPLPVAISGDDPVAF